MKRSRTEPASGFLFPELAANAGLRGGETPPIAAERLPTNTTTYQHPIHRWFNFIAGFSPEFVQECCRAAPTGADPLLLDPFAGCATALVVACQRGLRAVGFESHPVFCRIARAKLPSSHALADLEAIQRVIRSGLSRPKPLTLLPIAAARFLRKLFPVPSLESLLGAREALRDVRLAENDLAFLMLSRLLEEGSHSQTDGIYKAPTTRKHARPLPEAFREIVEKIRLDLRALGWTFAERARVCDQSSECMAPVASGSVSLVVTSPPYLNNFDYAEMTRMHLYFWGFAASWSEITHKVRSRLIVNTATALSRQHKFLQEKYRASVPGGLRPDLDALVRELAGRRGERAGKKEYHYLVYPYFAQMTEVFREYFRCLRPSAPIHLMVADAALYGVHISTPQLLCRILGALGFRDPACTLVRKRGHRWILAKREGSTRGLGEYHVQAIR
jgi:DNA modification methylase